MARVLICEQDFDLAAEVARLRAGDGGVGAVPGITGLATAAAAAAAAPQPPPAAPRSEC